MMSGSGYDKSAKFHLFLYRTPKLKGKKTNIYVVYKNSIHSPNKERLGIIKWEGGWRQYVFHPDNSTIWSSGCLEIITKFLKDKNKRQREKLRKERLIKKYGAP